MRDTLKAMRGDIAGADTGAAGSVVAATGREQTLNQLLVETDRFNTDARVIIVAAANRTHMLDYALLRPSRCQPARHSRPARRCGAVGILGVHARGKRPEMSVDLETVARATPGFSGAKPGRPSERGPDPGWPR